MQTSRTKNKPVIGAFKFSLNEGPEVKSDHIRGFLTHDFLLDGFTLQASRMNKRVMSTFASFQVTNDLLDSSSLQQSADILWVKNFVEIALYRTVSEINAFLHFTQKFKTSAKNSGKAIVGEIASRLCLYSAGQKCCRNGSILNPFRECVFTFYAEIQDGRKKWQESDFWEKSLVDSTDTLRSTISSKSLYLAPFLR